MNRLDIAVDMPNAAYEAALDRAIAESRKLYPYEDFSDPAIRTIYIAGKMSGLPHFGFDKFDAAAAELRQLGYLVLSPAEMDDPDERRNAWDSPDGRVSRSTLPRAHFLKRDYLIVCEVDMLVVLPTWKDSEGALGETLIAFSLNKPVFEYPDLSRQLTWADHPYSRNWSELARRDLMAMRSDRSEEVARAFHETYERLAPSHGYETREASAVPWEDVPESNRELMVATVEDLRARGVIS